MNSRQFMRWLMAKLTPMLRIVVSSTGSSQLGFRTMSSKVALGEKNTPTIRPSELIGAGGCACASDIGVGVVAIENSSTTDLKLPVLDRSTHRNWGKFQADFSSSGGNKETKIGEQGSEIRES